MNCAQVVSPAWLPGEQPARAVVPPTPTPIDVTSLFIVVSVPFNIPGMADVTYSVTRETDRRKKFGRSDDECARAWKNRSITDRAG